jgi:hypothetical protein
MHPLSDRHGDMLHKQSAIAPHIIEQRGYGTVTIKADLHRLFSPAQARVPALLIPIWGVTGEIALYQSRPDEPRIVKGKAVKYETLIGSSMVLDVYPTSVPALGDPAKALYITEGIKKSDALTSRGCCAIALLGVWNWRGTNEWGGKCALPDWDSIALNGRLVYLMFDSDIMQKRPVYEALRRLRDFLERRGGNVFIVYLPAHSGEKVGVDDYLANGASLDDLHSHATQRLVAPDMSHEPNGPYERRPEGLFWIKTTKDGNVPIQLTISR